MQQRVFSLSAVALMLLLLGGCIVVKDSPAPGCIEYIGFPMAGGCYGKTAILDLSVDPEEECLDITANNCNGGILEVHNGCNEAFVLGGVTIAPGDRAGLDVTEEGNEHSLVEVSSNFSEYIPESDERVQIAGTLGSRAVWVTFTKTGKLCE
jgi:hypothetical protein